MTPKHSLLAANCLLTVASATGALVTDGRSAPAPTIVLGSTTSVQDSGLLQYLLPAFTRETGITVHVLAQGTGQALATAAHGDADLVLVHDPDAEQAFMTAGHGVARREIAWNDFVLVGPAGDPAKIAGSRDPVAAFSAIWRARVPFVSRGDKSGTDAKEKRIWRAADLEPGHAEGGWYRDIGGGMGAALNAAAAMNAYTLSDRGTWLSFANKRDLRILVEGGRDLINRYDVITLNPAEHPAAGQEPAQRLADWLASAEAQKLIGDYTVHGQRLFHPEADPQP
jgi:tungstate transport system substrate-binding protein